MRTALVLAVLLVGVGATLLVVLPGSTDRDEGCLPTTTPGDVDRPIAILRRKFARISPPDRFPQRPRGDFVAAVDPRTLDPRTGQQVLLRKRITSPWAYSPDRRYLALGDIARSMVRIVDLERWRTWRKLRLPGRGSPIHLTWPEDKRLLAITSGKEDDAALVVDPGRGRVLAREVIPSRLDPIATDADTRRVLMLLAPTASIGRATFAVFTAAGLLRTTRLSRVPAGLRPVKIEGSGHHEAPGLALDPDRERAFVVAADAPVAEVATDSLDVTYHRVDALEDGGEAAPADASHTRNHLRAAVWLGCDTLAVAGTNYRPSGGPKFRPAGLALIDTRDWSSSTVDPHADYVVGAEGVLIASGLREPALYPAAGILRPTGLTVYSLTGAKLAHFPGGREPTLLAAGAGYGYFEYTDQPPGPVQVFDLQSGASEGTVDTPGSTRLAALAGRDSSPSSQAGSTLGYTYP
jgi:hypothetical protein